MINILRHHITNRLGNDVQHLEQLLQQYDVQTPKLIAYESVYSMCNFSLF